MNIHIRLDSRRAILSFSSRFGNQSLVKEKKMGAEEILNRIKGEG